MNVRTIFLLVAVSAQSVVAAIDATLVLLPKTWDHASALPVAIWLHGYGANPSSLRDDEHYQVTADALQIAIVGVPATREVAADSYIWSELPEFDLERVQSGLAEASRRSGARFSSKMLFGFSQGAVVATELAARYPRVFAGAIILSPGADIFPTPIPESEGNRRQMFAISTGADEAPGNLNFARTYRDVLSALGSRIVYREVSGMKKHGRPPDWPERFREWASEILALQPKPANQTPEPTPTAVTPRADARVAPAAVVAHL